MPLLLGVLESRFKVYQVVAGIGLLTLGVGIFYLFVRFPLAKEQQGLTEIKSLPFFRNSFLILIAFFLFCQSGFEAIINNWTTTYLTVIQSSTESNALYALSLHIAGMIVMRILIGTAFRSMSQVTIMWVSLILLLLGTLMLQVGLSFTLSVAGLVLLGAGVAAGFPVMLGFVGDVYFARSGAAFSFVMVIALIGNMLINYFTGVIVKDYGVQHLTTVSYAVVITMMVLCIFIFKRLNSK
jgi:MFS transporter, FHS family, glucose/mannose:H+ symporter